MERAKKKRMEWLEYASRMDWTDEIEEKRRNRRLKKAGEMRQCWWTDHIQMDWLMSDQHGDTAGISILEEQPVMDKTTPPSRNSPVVSYIGEQYPPVPLLAEASICTALQYKHTVCKPVYTPVLRKTQYHDTDVEGGDVAKMLCFVPSTGGGELGYTEEDSGKKKTLTPRTIRKARRKKGVPDGLVNQRITLFLTRNPSSSTSTRKAVGKEKLELGPLPNNPMETTIQLGEGKTEFLEVFDRIIGRKRRLSGGGVVTSQEKKRK
jgi:hypothetical protein